MGTTTDLFANVLFLMCAILILRSRHIKGGIDHLRDGLNFSAQLLLNAVKIEPIFVGDQIDGDTEMPETPGSTDSVQIGLRHLGEIKVNNNVHSLYVDTSREEIGADQIPAQSGSEVMENAISVRLLHLGVDVVATVAKLGDLFRQQFDTLCRIAEDDRLVDLQLGEQGIEAVHLLSLLDERVVLGDTLQG